MTPISRLNKLKYLKIYGNKISTFIGLSNCDVDICTFDITELRTRNR